MQTCSTLCVANCYAAYATHIDHTTCSRSSHNVLYIPRVLYQQNPPSLLLFPRHIHNHYWILSIQAYCLVSRGLAWPDSSKWII